MNLLLYVGIVAELIDKAKLEEYHQSCQEKCQEDLDCYLECMESYYTPIIESDNETPESEGARLQERHQLCKDTSKDINDYIKCMEEFYVHTIIDELPEMSFGEMCSEACKTDNMDCLANCEGNFQHYDDICKSACGGDMDCYVKCMKDLLIAGQYKETPTSP